MKMTLLAIHILWAMASVLSFNACKSDTHTAHMTTSVTHAADTFRGSNNPNNLQPHTTTTTNTASTMLKLPNINNDYLMGKFTPATHPDFTPINIKYADRAGMFLRKDALDAFVKMYTAAAADGVNLKIISAARNFDQQKQIWEDKWDGKTLVGGAKLNETTPDPTQRALAILTYSSMPSTSRHHWGTDIDLNSLEPNFFNNTDEGKKIYTWLARRAPEFGFCQPYSPKDATRPNGYNEEKWHWSYMPVAKQLLAEYQRTINNTMITGFKGSETAATIDMLNKYVLGVNATCK
jgi:D-alanyl-D-alanine carboxypeptidase